MEAVKFQFPIDNLPQRPFSYVLRTMNLVDRVAYSFISPESKQQICALPQKKVASMMVYFTDFIRIRIYFDGRTSDYVDFLFMEPYALELSITHEMRVTASNTFRPVKPFSTFPNRQGYTFKDYVNHLADIFHCKTLVMVYFQMASNIYPVEQIWKALDRFSKIERVDMNTLFSEELVLKFVSKARICIIRNKHPFDQKSLPKVLIQNLDEFYMTHSTIISLNDLLLINSIEASVVTELNEKQLNLFLKNWMSGSNPRLRKLSIDNRNQEKQSVENILKGIKYEETSDWDQLDFFYRKDHHSKMIFDGFEILSLDGNAKATILIHKMSIRFKMIVQDL